jgi:hypothetical protein
MQGRPLRTHHACTDARETNAVIPGRKREQEALQCFKKEGHIQSLNMQGAVNGAVFSEAVNRKRVFITGDDDFLRNKKHDHSGSLVLKIIPRRDNFVIPVVEEFLNSRENDDINWENRIILLTENGFSIVL